MILAYCLYVCYKCYLFQTSTFYKLPQHFKLITYYIHLNIRVVPKT